MNPDSYVSANTIPIKLVHNTDLAGLVKDGFVPPIHAQLIPTNRCNLSCSFCSCSERNKMDELDYHRLLKAVVMLKYLGCKSVTVTGGGEPLMYSNINHLFEELHKNNIKIGLVTNGTQFSRLKNYSGITWIRISSSDERDLPLRDISVYVKDHPQVDWAFSHVLTKKPHFNRIENIIEFAKDHKFTHVRLVSDLVDIDNASKNMAAVKKRFADKDGGIVIYQDRKIWEKGVKNCLISLLKPLIGADGGIYPCCGIQYAMDPPSLDFSKDTKMGNMENLYEIWNNQKHFDGSKCVKCYYSDYNSMLGMLQSQVEHKEFV